MNLKRIDKIHSLNDLPKLKYTAVKIGKKVFLSGAIIKRKTLFNFDHFGILYGVDHKGTCWIIENNQNGVQCVTFRDFMSEKDDFTIINSSKNIYFYKNVIERAMKVSEKAYDLLNFNCDQFVNYAVYGKAFSKQKEDAELFIKDILKIGMIYGLVSLGMSILDKRTQK